MDGADVIPAEEVFEVCGDSSEASAIHADEKSGDEHEERDGVEMGSASDGQNPIENCSQREEDHVSGLAADEVGGAGPEKSSGHIEEAENPDEPASGDSRDMPMKEVLNHRRGLFEDADAGGDIHAEDDPK